MIEHDQDITPIDQERLLDRLGTVRREIMGYLMGHYDLRDDEAMVVLDRLWTVLGEGE